MNTESKTPTRIYLVHHAHSKKSSLVMASTAAQALHHIIKAEYTVCVANQAALVRMISDGAKVEQAGVE